MDGELRDVHRCNPGARASRRGRCPGAAVQQHAGGACRRVLRAVWATPEVRVGRRLGPRAHQVRAARVGRRRRRLRRSRGRLRRRRPARRRRGPRGRHPVRRPGPGRTPRRPGRQRRQSRGLVVRAGRRPPPGRPLPGDARHAPAGHGVGASGRGWAVRVRGRGPPDGRSRSSAPAGVPHRPPRPW
jgi:hypothetical protein